MPETGVLNGDPTLTLLAATVPPERRPITMTVAPSVMSLSGAAQMLAIVDSVVVTVTD